MLVDDYQPVAGLRHDIGVVHLRARRAERAGRADRRPARSSARGVRDRTATSNAACAASANAGAAAVARISARFERASRRQSPVMAAARRHRGRPERRDGGAPSGGRGAWPCAPSASCSARIIRLRTRPGSRKRTSALAGCTLTSTSRGSSVDEQGHDRMPVAGQVVRIGAAHHADQQLVAHRPSVDEQILTERVGAGERRQAAKPSTAKPSRPPCTSTALARNSAPSTSASRANRPAGPGSAAAHVAGARSSPASVKAMSGRLIARRRTTSRIASLSVRSLLRNFNRAGVA